MGRLDQMSWADFTAPWEHDVKAGLHWLQAALNLPLKPGSRVLVVSSGAAVNGSPLDPERRAGLLAQAGELRSELHRYCARLMGSTIEGEEVVQDTLVRAFVALQELEEQGLEEAPPLRPWLFRIAHNRALDVLRSRLHAMQSLINMQSMTNGGIWRV
jgi:hypothetical protein